MGAVRSSRASHGSLEKEGTTEEPVSVPPPSSGRKSSIRSNQRFHCISLFRSFY